MWPEEIYDNHIYKVREEFEKLDFIQWANITSLYEGKGDRLDISNERGIFIVSVFRSILVKLIYNEKYEIIDSNMSDSNVGARRNKNISNMYSLLWYN